MPDSHQLPADPFDRLRIDSLDELQHRLVPHDTIVCLGNGPSSEDSRLADYEKAILFRVNWIWAKRNWLGAPDLVFTGDPDLVRMAKQPLVAFPTRAIGEPILLDHYTNDHLPTAGFSFLDRFSPVLADLSGPQIPTNGALMITLAAALQPHRIVIAGIDLYRHPLGKYPGTTDNFEGYTNQHSAACDLTLIGRALSTYQGDLIILSENLRGALDS